MNEGLSSGGGGGGHLFQFLKHLLLKSFLQQRLGNLTIFFPVLHKNTPTADEEGGLTEIRRVQLQNLQRGGGLLEWGANREWG